MKKHLIFSLLVFAVVSVSAQTISSKKWQDFFSYNNVSVIKEANGKIVAASENGIFFYNPTNGEITKLSKANGLHDIQITAFDYNPQLQTGLIGYKNGGMDVITPDKVLYVVDIPLAVGYSGSKKINHISITGNQAVISVGYGVSIFNLEKKEFGKSAFFNQGTSYEASNEAVIKDNKIFAATATGIKMHELDVTFPVYSTWATVVSGNFRHIDAKSGMAFSTANNVYVENGGSFTPVSQVFSDIKDVVVTSGNIVVTDTSQIYLFDINGNFQNSTSLGEACNTATYINGQIWGGTKVSGIKNSGLEIFKPDGPYQNYAYKIGIYGNNQLLVSTGAREGRFNVPAFNEYNTGFYYYTGSEWVYPTYFIGNTTPFNVLDVVANPSDNSEVFFTNYTMGSEMGIYKMKYDAGSKDFSFVKKYQPISKMRPVGLLYDDNNNLFVTAGYYTEGIYSSSSAIGYYNSGSDNFQMKGIGISSTVQKPVLRGNMLWIPLPRTNDFIAYDLKNTPTSLSDDLVYRITQSNGLPSNSVGSFSVALDNNDDAWIGTDSGLRVISNAVSSIKSDPKAEPIVIEQNGIAEELFRDSAILQIEVDSGNKKWVSVDGGGVYYLSEDGQKTIFHFTKENSPLPTNSVTDIKIDNKTGKVYFVTYNGIVSYQSDAIDVTSDFGNVQVYPNPVVYSNFKGDVTIRGLAMKTNIRITDAAGNLVHQGVARGGFYQWNLNNMRGKRVSSGVYFVLMTNEKGTDKATAKIAIVN